MYNKLIYAHIFLSPLFFIIVKQMGPMLAMFGGGDMGGGGGGFKMDL